MPWTLFMFSFHFIFINYIVCTDHEIICENAVSTLQCDENKTLHIVTAMFGRASKYICLDNATDQHDCQTLDALPIVEVLCEGKSKCRIPAIKTLFGNSCGDIPSYAEILYACKNNNEDKDLPSGFLLSNNKAIHLGASGNLVIAVGVLATLFTLASVALVVIGIQAWRKRYRYIRNDTDHNDDLDWSLYSSHRSNIQYDQIHSGFNSPIFTGNEPLTNQTSRAFYFD